ncbi:MAG TPA: crossover junction endodeoxyribonuclease RuvC [Candidatus Kapabacteria bacterium]|nr:crossover junction endodeoxyribonuclease RuvC [Candidatus Kapabacteria bacterium]
MVILGVDPGTLVTGYGVIESEGRGSKIRIIEYGTIESKKIATLPIRLEKIYRRLEAVIERTNPDQFAIETAFYDKNIQSTLKLGHARGVAILAAVLRQVPTTEYSPREVKRAVAGNGNASKPQVEYMIRSILKIPASEKKLADAFDALAIAVTHAYRMNTAATGAFKNWEQFVSENPDRVKSAAPVVKSPLAKTRSIAKSPARKK